MKLSNQQVDAILNLLEEQHNEKAQKKNLEAAKAKEKSVEKDAERLLKIYHSIPPELVRIINRLYSHEKLTKAKLIDKITEKKPIPRFKRDLMRSKVVIMSIESKDIDQLKKKLNITL